MGPVLEGGAAARDAREGLGAGREARAAPAQGQHCPPSSPRPISPRLTRSCSPPSPSPPPRLNLPPRQTLQASPQTRKREMQAGQSRPASASPVRAPASPSPSVSRLAQSPGPGQPSPATSTAGAYRGANTQSSPGFAQHQLHLHHQHNQHHSQPSPAHLHQQQQQHASRGATPTRRPASAAAAGRRAERDPTPSAPIDRAKPRPEHGLERGDGAEPRPRLHRCDDPRTPAEQLILAGQYRFSGAQQRVYAAFVEMLLGFDRHDQVRPGALAFQNPNAPFDF